jgi:hypothetical protein
MIRNIIITIREPGTSCKKYFIIKWKNSFKKNKRNDFII